MEMVLTYGELGKTGAETMHTETTMQAGKYYVGDLCYVFSNEEWEEVCDLIIEGQEVLQGKFTMKDGTEFTIFSTAYGDGCYTDDMGGAYAVDSGSIGCVLVDRFKTVNENLACVHEFQREFQCRNDDGVLQFGDVSIDTKGGDDYGYEEE